MAEGWAIRAASCGGHSRPLRTVFDAQEFDLWSLYDWNRVEHWFIPQLAVRKGWAQDHFWTICMNRWWLIFSMLEHQRWGVGTICSEKHELLSWRVISDHPWSRFSSLWSWCCSGPSSSLKSSLDFTSWIYLLGVPKHMRRWAWAYEVLQNLIQISLIFHLRCLLRTSSGYSCAKIDEIYCSGERTMNFLSEAGFL